MSGYREFAVGEVLTSSNVNEFLMNQSVMVFADASARDAALGTATGGTAALVEGMTVYRQDSEALEYYDGEVWRSVPPIGTATPTEGQVLSFGTATSTWNPVDAPVFDSREVITATDSSWSVPALGNPIVRVIVIGGGGGGAGANPGGNGGTSTFDAGGAGSLSAAGGDGATRDAGVTPTERTEGYASGNGGQSARSTSLNNPGPQANGGNIAIGYFDLGGVSTVNVTVGSGGSGGGSTPSWPVGGVGGRGEVIVEYKAG